MIKYYLPLIGIYYFFAKNDLKYGSLMFELTALYNAIQVAAIIYIGVLWMF